MATAMVVGAGLAVISRAIRLWTGSASRCPLLAKVGCRCFENETTEL